MDNSDENYREIFGIVTQVVNAQHENDTKLVWRLYNRLKYICEKYGNTHPFFYETLADFTSDSLIAISYYEKALEIGFNLKLHKYCSSIQLAMAERYFELGNVSDAVKCCKRARESAFIENDIEIIRKINEFMIKMRI